MSDESRNQMENHNANEDNNIEFEIAPDTNLLEENYSTIATLGSNNQSQPCSSGRSNLLT